MLSAQYGTVFTRSHYEKLRKVISIWVCFDVNKEKRNTINRYSYHEEPLYGAYKADEVDYKMSEVVILYIGDDTKTENIVLKMLDKIFAKKYNVDEKKRFLQEECGIAMTEAENAEVENMCNYSDYVEARGEARGEKRGEKRGKQAGNKERLLQDVRNLMETLNLSAEKAMQALKVSSEEQVELQAQL